MTGSPDELVAQFNQNLDPSRTSIEVRDASGATVARGGELGAGPREFRIALPDLAPGEYTVRWTSFSAEDGELARDTYTFTVVAAASPSPTPSPSRSPSPSPSSSAAAPASPSPTLVPATPAPSPSPTAGNGTSASGDGLAIVPILAAALVVAGLAVWLLRRRSA